MKKLLIGVMLGLFLSCVAIFDAQATEQEHTKEYLEWEEKTVNSMKLGSRCLEVKKGIKNLADGVEKKYGQDQKSLELISNYIERVHRIFIVNGMNILSMNKTSDMLGASASSDEPMRWFEGDLLKVMEPLDGLAYIPNKNPIEVKKISSAKLDGIRFLHIIVENLRNGGDFRKAIQDVNVFERKHKTYTSE